MIETMIDPDDLPRWKEILEDDEYPLTPYDLRLLVYRILGQIADRPTVRPSDSSSTESETGTRSTADSDSPAVAV